MVRMSHSSRGFTLLELLLSMAMIAVLAGIGVPIVVRAQTKNDLDTAVSVWVSTLRRAEVLAQAVDGDSQWGGKIQNGSVVLFKGTSYATRDTNFDEVFSLPTTITVSGVSEIVMDKLSGYPTATGTTTLTSSVATGDNASVIISSKGVVSW